MGKQFPAAEFLDYIVAWIAEATAAQYGLTGIEARKLRRTIDAAQRQLLKAWRDPELLRGYMSALGPLLRRTIDAPQRQLLKAELLRGRMSAPGPLQEHSTNSSSDPLLGMEAMNILDNLRFRIECQAGLTLHAKDQELELLYVASMFSPIASIAEKLASAGGRRREPTAIAEALRQFRRKHDETDLIAIVEKYFGFFKSNQFRKLHPRKQRTITGLRLSGVNQRELLTISRFVREHEARHKRKTERPGAFRGKTKLFAK